MSADDVPSMTDKELVELVRSEFSRDESPLDGAFATLSAALEAEEAANVRKLRRLRLVRSLVLVASVGFGFSLVLIPLALGLGIASAPLVAVVSGAVLGSFASLAIACLLR